MSFETTRQLITARFQDQWDEADLPIVYDNQPAPRQDVAFGRFTVLQGDTNPMAIGGQTATRGFGVAVLQMFIPEAAGTKAFTENADRFATIFNLWRGRDGDHYVAFDTVGIADAGKTAGWLHRQARVTFRRDSHA